MRHSRSSAVHGTRPTPRQAQKDQRKRSSGTRKDTDSVLLPRAEAAVLGFRPHATPGQRLSWRARADRGPGLGARLPTPGQVARGAEGPGLPAGES